MGLALSRTWGLSPELEGKKRFQGQQTQLRVKSGLCFFRDHVREGTAQPPFNGQPEVFGTPGDTADHQVFE